MAHFYEKIKNPIDDDSVIKKLIEAYSNSYNGLGGFYGRLTQTVEKDYKKGEHYVTDKDEFEAMLFNCWKKNVLEMSQAEYIALYQKGKLGEDFPVARNYLKTVKDVTTAKEVRETMFLNVKDNLELRDALSKYSWKQIGEGSGWVHVCSKYVKARREGGFNIEERLYLNTESMHTYRIAIEFIKKCEARNLPYYFKFDEYGNRDDTIVIYSSNELLPAYLSILEEIKEEQPYIISEIKQPPLLTGRIDGWLGIGSEPRHENGNRQSFNGKRAKLIEATIERIMVKWAMDHLNFSTKYHEKGMTFKEYLAVRMAENRIDEMKTSWKNRVQYLKEGEKRSGTPYRESEVIKSLGYSLEGIQNPRFLDALSSFLKPNIEGLVDKLSKGNGNEIRLVTNINNREVRFYESDILKVLKQELPRIIRIEPWLIGFIRTQIKANAGKFGIDKDMFCFDLGTMDELKKVFEGKENVTDKGNVDNKVEALKKQIEYFEECGEYDRAAYYKEVLARINRESDEVFIDYSVLRKNIIDEMKIAEQTLNYRRIGELKGQLAIVEFARSKNNLSYEDKIALYEEKIKVAEETNDYVSRATWMQLLDLARNSKGKNFS